MWSIDEANLKMARLRELPYGPGRTAAAEFIARTIENEGPEQALPEALMELVEAYVFGTPNPASFATFSRLLRLWDAHPEHFSEDGARTLFWQFKWVTGDLAAWPQISRQQARGLLDEMRKRYALAGFSAAAVDRAEYMWAGHLGLDEEAERWRATWLAHGEDEMDCGSCKIGGALRDYLVAGEFEQAITLGAPTEDLCNREPANSHRYLAMAHLELGDGVSAGRHLARAQATRNQYDPDDLGLEFEIMARGGQLEAALDLLAAHGSRALRLEGDPGDNRGFLRYLVAGLSWALEDHRNLKTRLPQAKTLAGLHEWALRESAPLVRAFDERAGNTSFSESLERAVREPRLADLVLVTGSSLATSGQGAEPGGAAGAGRKDAGHKDAGAGVAPAQAAGQGPVEMPGDDTDYYTTADGFLAGGDLVQAAHWYERTGAQRTASGDRLGAGIALADAAQCYATLRERERASDLFERAWGLLSDEQAPAALVLAIALAHGKLAEATGQTAPLIAVTNLAQDLADAECEQLEQDGAPQWRLHQSSLLVMHATDLRARALAATGQSEEAMQTAKEVAEVYLKIGETARGASALLLAGQCARDTGDTTSAVEVLETAVAAFEQANRKESKAQALNLLIEVLNASGQTHRVEALMDDIL